MNDKRVVVNVATGRHYLKGQARLQKTLADIAPNNLLLCWNSMPPRCPEHDKVPYAFKAYAMVAAAERGFTSILWADASILPIQRLELLWHKIEDDGYWISDNGWINGQWCSDAALKPLGITREESFQQKHVVATAFGLSLKKEIGRTFLKEYYRLASETTAFCGPWTNKNGEASSDPRVLGHRHDQTAASVIAHRLNMVLTQPPDWFAYKGHENENTILLADGAY